MHVYEDQDILPGHQLLDFLLFITASLQILTVKQLSHPIIFTTSKQSLIMSPKYAKDQPAGFVNRIEKVAIVGVSIRAVSPQHRTNQTLTGRRHPRQLRRQGAPQGRQAHHHGAHPAQQHQQAARGRQVRSRRLRQPSIARQGPRGPAGPRHHAQRARPARHGGEADPRGGRGRRAVHHVGTLRDFASPFRLSLES